MDIAVLDKLRAVVGATNVLGTVELAPYVVEGRTPEAALVPGSVDEVRAVVEIAAGAGIPIVPWGGGTAAAVGTPTPQPGIVLDLKRLGQLVEHEPGDLTATVEAGMTMAALQSALRARGQWLSLDPPDPEQATIGGVIAANASGPRRHLYGTARDLLIGVTVVTGDGVVVRGGGKVVKNVAGYDLPKLFVGSHGTLGVIVSVTVKLRPLPDDERLVAVVFDRLKDAGAAARAVVASDLIPNALEILDAEAARALGLQSAEGSGRCTLVVGFDGVREQVEWQCSELGRIAAPGNPQLDADHRAITHAPVKLLQAEVAMVGIQIHKTKGAAGPAAHSLQHLVVFLAELLRGWIGLKREPQGEHNPVDSQTVRELDQLRHALFRGFSWRRTEMAVHIPDQGWRVRFRGAGEPGLGLSQRQGQASAKASEKCSPVEHKGLEFSLQAAPSLSRLKPELRTTSSLVRPEG